MTDVTPRGGLSIRARLAIWYAASVLLVFLVFAFALRATVRAALRNEFTAGVTSSASAIRSFFRLEYAEYRDVNATIVHIANEVVFPDRIVEFLTLADSVAFRVGPDRKGAAAASPSPSQANGQLLPPVEHVLAPLDTGIARGWQLRVFASAAPLERSLALIDQWLLIGIPLGFLVAGGTGWWLAGRTLRPVGAMAEAATRMASARADRRRGAAAQVERLPIDNPSDELGRLGTRFNALLDQVDLVLGQQRHFLADAAHELRTPVARMLGSVELALLDSGDAAAQSAALQAVRADLTRTARLVDELLQLARADAVGELHLRPAYVDDVVVDAVHAWQPAAERKGVTLALQAFDETPAALDPVYLERLVGILVDNAIRYTPAGGTVTVNITQPEGAPTLTVADTGIGITDDERTRVFERFFRGASARLMSAEGSGLGLPIARWIADAHGATLVLSARPGGGTVATLTFPAPARPAAEPRPA